MPSTMKPVRVLLFAMSIVASACGQSGAVSADEQLPALRLVPTTTSTTVAPFVPVDDRAADLSAQADLEAGLAVALELYGSRATFDVLPAELNRIHPELRFVTLQQAASVDGVVYDAHDQRVTLYRESASGTWFCIDQGTSADTDYGLGDSFQAALTDCNDGITSVGWRNAFEANGLDESAVENLLIGLGRALAAGDVSDAHGSFHPNRACAVQELLAIWPDGRGLGRDAELEILGVTITDDSAVASVNLGEMADVLWDLERYGEDWYLSAEACKVLAPLAVTAQDGQARSLLLDGLAAVRVGFVERSAFDSPAAVLANIEPTVVFVPIDESDWAVVGYRSDPSYGLVVTVGAPGHFFCAVESLRAVTGYGVGVALNEVDSQAECSQTTGELPEFD